MTISNPQPTPEDWAGLVQRLKEMRDALVTTALALRDHQFTLDSAERHAAGLQAAHLIARAQARSLSEADDRDSGCKSAGRPSDLS